mmetsp:Transcript_11394/g.38843  ORF Transcript_11394/g.38843 Transcript_11394/m.38843 type:complete len:252 (+) Transcript_11394:133-888(+)
MAALFSVRVPPGRRAGHARGRGQHQGILCVEPPGQLRVGRRVCQAVWPCAGGLRPGPGAPAKGLLPLVRLGHPGDELPAEGHGPPGGAAAASRGRTLAPGPLRGALGGGRCLCGDHGGGRGGGLWLGPQAGARQGGGLPGGRAPRLLRGGGLPCGAPWDGPAAWREPARVRPHARGMHTCECACAYEDAREPLLFFLSVGSSVHGMHEALRARWDGCTIRALSAVKLPAPGLAAGGGPFPPDPTRPHSIIA